MYWTIWITQFQSFEEKGGLFSDLSKVYSLQKIFGNKIADFLFLYCPAAIGKAFRGGNVQVPLEKKTHAPPHAESLWLR